MKDRVKIQFNKSKKSAVQYVPPFYTSFICMIEIYVIENYKEMYPDLSGSQLTDACILDCLTACNLCKCQPAEIKRTEKGKPYVNSEPGTQGLTEIHISVSHSGEYFVCAVADIPIGIDVQKTQKANMERISRRYFSPPERAYIEEHGEKGFFTIWTRKEAYSKYTGLGLEEIMKGTEILGREDVEFLDFQLEEGMYCTCCMRK